MKFRLVAKGYDQTYGVNYSDTFSFVAKLTSVMLIISMTVTHNWPLHHLDIKNAFLRGDLKEEVYMEQPPDFDAQGEYEKVRRLRKTLYGLNKTLEPGLENLVRQFSNLECRKVSTIVMCSTKLEICGRYFHYWI